VRQADETSSARLPILRCVQTPDPLPSEPAPRPRPLGGEVEPPRGGRYWGFGELLTWVSGLVLALSSFTNWYSGTEAGASFTLSVTGWHTGALGKLVFFIGVAVILLFAVRDAGFELPAAVPDSLVVIALGSLATIFVLVRLISIPDTFLPASGRGVGIWISLVAALAVIVAGLVRASEEL
jgi:hypothetical protein